MEPRTQSQGSLQPPGRIPPTAIGTAATPPPAPAPKQEGHRARPSRVGRWIVSLAPMPIMVVSSVFVVESRHADTQMLAFLIYTVSIFLIGLFLGLGRYRGSGE